MFYADNIQVDDVSSESPIRKKIQEEGTAVILFKVNGHQSTIMMVGFATTRNKN